MFEKEAEEYAEAFVNRGIAKASFKKGAEFGYNKANEWHYVKDGDLPEADNRVVLCVCGDGYIDEKKTLHT